MRHFVILAVLVPFVGCSASVNGAVDNQSVPALFSAFFVQRKVDAVDPGGQPATLFTVNAGGLSVFDGCTEMAKRQVADNDAFHTQTKALNDAGTDIDKTKKANNDFFSAEADYDAKHLPSDYWAASVQLSAFSENDLNGGKADIDVQCQSAVDCAQDEVCVASSPTVSACQKPADPRPKGDTIIGQVSLCRVDNFPETKTDSDGFVSLLRHDSCFNAKKGTVNVSSYTKDKTVTVTADVDFARADKLNDDAGSAVVTISGGWCTDLENALDERDGLVKDRAQPAGG